MTIPINLTLPSTWTDGMEVFPLKSLLSRDAATKETGGFIWYPFQGNRNVDDIYLCLDHRNIDASYELLLAH